MTDKTFRFQFVARAVAVIFAFCFSAFFLFALAFTTRPWPLIDQVIGGLMVLYIVGLVLGLKQPGIGGLLTIILPVFEIINILISGFSISSLSFYLILLIPTILYFLSWRLQVRQE
jgi:hypothetical protein